MKALIADDDRVLADVVAFTLRREGFQVIHAYDGEKALQRWAEEQPDLVVLDVNMPKLDGFAVCRRIRAQSDTPILLLTVRGEEDDVVRGLELGADDYITKPFSPRQLVARAHAVLRRAGEMRVGGYEAVSLTPLESRLLDYLMLNAGSVLTAEALIDHVWGHKGGDRDMLRQLVHRLRVKIAQACGADTDASDITTQVSIETVPGLGYGLTISAAVD